jgi:flavorubredoxin
MKSIEVENENVQRHLSHTSERRDEKDIDVEISEIKDGIYRISGMVDTYGITFNQFLITDELPMLIHTGPIGMYTKIEEKVKEVIPLQKLAYVSFLHFESDEW